MEGSCCLGSGDLSEPRIRALEEDAFVAVDAIMQRPSVMIRELKADRAYSVLIVKFHKDLSTVKAEPDETPSRRASQNQSISQYRQIKDSPGVEPIFTSEGRIDP